MSTLNDAVEAIRLGKPEEGRQILEELLEVDENDGEIWLWLSTVVDNEEDCEICLENVLALDPHNAAAQKGLEALQAGAFSPHLILDELLEIDEHEAPEPTFIEDFVITDDDLPDDDEIKFPSTMVTETKPKKSGKGCKPNLRIILLAVIALVIVMVLAGLAVMNLFSGSDGDSGGPAGGQTQEIPAGGGTEEQPPPPVATDTPTPIPANTPTPTITPFKLPTPLPTPEPSPTATQVVAPTPGQ